MWWSLTVLEFLLESSLVGLAGVSVSGPVSALLLPSSRCPNPKRNRPWSVSVCLTARTVPPPSVAPNVDASHARAMARCGADVRCVTVPSAALCAPRATGAPDAAPDETARRRQSQAEGHLVVDRAILHAPLEAVANLGGPGQRNQLSQNLCATHASARPPGRMRRNRPAQTPERSVWSRPQILPGHKCTFKRPRPMRPRSTRTCARARGALGATLLTPLSPRRHVVRTCWPRMQAPRVAQARSATTQRACCSAPDGSDGTRGLGVQTHEPLGWGRCARRGPAEGTHRDERDPQQPSAKCRTKHALGSTKPIARHPHR